MALTLAQIDQLRSTFVANGWSLEPSEPGHARFDRFADLLDKLAPAEQELLLALTSDFLAHGLGEYGRGVSKLLDQVLQADWDPVRDGPLIVVPLVRRTDIGIPKSGGMTVYLVRSELRFRGVPHFSWDRPGLVAEKLPDRDDAVVLIVDDYIGSGGSAKSAHDFFLDDFGKASDRIIIGALVAQEVGLRYLAAEGIEARHVITRVRGISDSKRLADKDSALRIMDGIEDKMLVPAEWRLGYRQSEALLSLFRCPNNTFPVYWMRPRGQLGWEAPFGR